MNLPQILTLYSGKKMPLDPVLEVWEMNYQEVNKVSVLGGLLAWIMYSLLCL